MTEKISELTPEQHKRMEEYRDAQQQLAMSTKRINPKKAKESVINLYKVSKITPPTHMYIFDSPVQALLMRGMLKIAIDRKMKIPTKEIL